MKRTAFILTGVLFAVWVTGCGTSINPILRGAKIDYMHERYDIAITKIHKSLELNPLDGDAYYYLGASYLNTKQYDEAFAAFERASKLDTALVDDIEKEISRNWTKLYNDGINYLNDKKPEKAAKKLMNATSLDPRRVDNYTALSTVYAALNDPESAFLCNKRAILLDEANITALDNLGVYHYNKLEFAEAAVYFEKILELEPENMRSLELTADSYAKNGDYQNARVKYGDMMILEPDNPDLLVNASAMEIEAGEMVKAKDLCETGIALFPDNVDILINYVSICRDLGIADEALATIEVAVEANPGSEDLIIAFATILYELNDYNGAITTLEESGLTFGAGQEDGLRDQS